MFTKNRLSFLIAILLSVFAAGTALAADEAPPVPETGLEGRRRPRAVAGVVLAVDLPASRFEMRLRSGASQTVEVDENTRFRGIAAGLADLQAGMRVVAAGRLSPDGLLRAVTVGVPDPANRQAAGAVESVDSGGGALDLATHRGDVLTIKVTEETKFRGLAAGLEAIEPGMRAVVAFREEPGGALIGLWIAVPERLQRRRFAGQVTQVNADQGTFALRTLSGEDLTIQVRENTVFRSPTGEVEALEDLQVGMAAGVGAQLQPDGSLAALAVVAGRARFEVRLLGEIVEIDSQGFSLRTPDGRVLALLVDESTRFRSPGGNVTGLEDLESGMVIAVGGRALSGAEILALVILAR